MLILLFISILYLQECTTQSCIYKLDQFETISCSRTGKIREEIDETLEHHGSLPRLIKFLKVKDCNFLSLSIHSFTRFLPNLTELSLSHNNVKKLSPDNIKDFIVGT